MVTETPLSPHLTVTDELTEMRYAYLNRMYTRKVLQRYISGKVSGTSNMKKHDIIGKVLGYLQYEMIPYRCGWMSLIKDIDESQFERSN